MNNITVHGIDEAAFFDTTKAALEAFQGSPIHKNAKIRQFLATQFNQANEHIISKMFVNIPMPSIMYQPSKPPVEIDDSELIAVLKSLDFLQSWNDDNEYIDRNFDIRAHDEKAKEKDITLDFRISFNSKDNYAAVIIGKNYGDGSSGDIEFPLRDVPNFESLTLELPDFITKDEIWDGYHELVIIYNAISENETLKDCFITDPEEIEIEAVINPISSGEKHTQQINDMFDANDAEEVMESFDKAMSRIHNESLTETTEMQLDTGYPNAIPNIISLDDECKPVVIEGSELATNKKVLKPSKGIKFTKEDQVEIVPTGVYIITTLRYENNDSGTGMVLDKDDITNITCLEQNKLNSKLQEAFSTAFPDNDGTVNDVMNFTMVGVKVEELAVDTGDARRIEEELYAMSAWEIRDWLLENFDINDLIDNMLKELTMGFYEIKWELVSL